MTDTATLLRDVARLAALGLDAADILAITPTPDEIDCAWCGAVDTREIVDGEPVGAPFRQDEDGCWMCPDCWDDAHFVPFLDPNDPELHGVDPDAARDLMTGR